MHTETFTTLFHKKQGQKNTAAFLRWWSTVSRRGKECRNVSIVVTFVKPRTAAMLSTGPWPDTRTCLSRNCRNMQSGLWDKITWSALTFHHCKQTQQCVTAARQSTTDTKIRN